jgi:hypothetical protein
VRGEASDRDPKRDSQSPERREHLFQEPLAARILKADRVEHAVVGLRDAVGLVPLARLRGHGLRDEGIQ